MTHGSDVLRILAEPAGSSAWTNTEEGHPDMDLLQRTTATRYPAPVQLDPRICRTCQLERTRQDHQCEDLLVGQCRECRDPSL